MTAMGKQSVNQCLKCQKSIENPTGRAKFCSTNCRVGYHKQNRGKEIKLSDKAKLDFIFEGMKKLLAENS